MVTKRFKCQYTCGVGEGFEPGSNFFLISVNIVLAWFLFLLVFLFIAETQSYTGVGDINQIIQKTYRDSAALVQWSQEGGIALNPDKVRVV